MRNGLANLLCKPNCNPTTRHSIVPSNTSPDFRRLKCLLALGALQKIHLQSGEVLKRSAMLFATDCHQSPDLSARSQWLWL